MPVRDSTVTIAWSSDFLLLPGDSPLTKFLEIASIPRYLLLDKGHRVVSMDAPRPTPGELPALKRLIESVR